MEKDLILTAIKKTGVVAVIRADNEEQAYKITDACLEGGISSLEITFTVPRAHNIIESLDKKYGNDILLGAGTVLDPETARIAILSGAKYIVSPYLNTDMIKLCNRYQVPTMPGVMTIKEVVEAMEAGADILKIFPGGVFGPKIIKDIKGPLPQAQLMPTGGVSIDNVQEWIKAGAVAVGVGSSLTKGAKTGDYDLVTKMAKEFIKKVKIARG
ncbi:MAG: bifunctional 2-keto-4-hydroxyglutarate aldolase/2-keto-3-deoxy-6-phosphogluconate aldolase [Clostridiales bacterium]|nr:bifunctional 2-keto-4-hydroxyglutarate aldolase/2-keto-3-deoxy-6-phosphogluconate aldolase [Clostridiales bacterium]